MSCGNGAERTPHPAEFWGADWEDWQPEKLALPDKACAGNSTDESGKATCETTDKPDKQ